MARDDAPRHSQATSLRLIGWRRIRPAASLTCLRRFATSADALLAFKGGLTNFDEVAAARGYAGWCTTPGGPDCVYACGWSGVTCDRGRVSRLDLSCPLAGCAGGVPLRGTLGPGLETLELLQTLDLSGNELSGELPPEWGFNGTFPSVQVFDLSRNRLKGAIPDAWAYSGGFQEVVVFDVSRETWLCAALAAHAALPAGVGVRAAARRCGGIGAGGLTLARPWRLHAPLARS